MYTGGPPSPATRVAVATTAVTGHCGSAPQVRVFRSTAGGPVRAEPASMRKRLGFFIVLVTLAVGAIGCNDCQPCEDPSQLFCAD